MRIRICYLLPRKFFALRALFGRLRVCGARALVRAGTHGSDVKDVVCADPVSLAYVRTARGEMMLTHIFDTSKLPLSVGRRTLQRLELNYYRLHMGETKQKNKKTK